MKAPLRMRNVPLGSRTMSKRDADYFADRALVELAMSKVATDERAIAAHLEMAERYEKLAREFAVEQPELRVA